MCCDCCHSSRGCLRLLCRGHANPASAQIPVHSNDHSSPQVYIGLPARGGLVVLYQHIIDHLKGS